ncbi:MULTISPECIES: MFS transporter [unclassified Streptomyces]|uniref:MFS transporter n=1 Tax=unclassified Streptomyces TaxID=2593676 RepID=UPI000DB9B8F9|nr:MULTISPECIES: MFS transporter [unclassified Streptomyces]MYT68243.1 MFS transporter [Streptomyces sp. SID8367]RAJ76875.1 putative MFS family arabinose efflux permease [Streptomyces sp. PsTaAH-137]
MSGTGPGPWRHPVLRAVLAAECVSMLGSALTVVAVPWLMLSATGSARAMGLVMAAQMAGTTLVGTLGASWAGRAGPRRVMLLGDACRGALIALVPLLTATGGLAVPLTAAAMFLFGAFMAPYAAAQQALLPDVVGEDEKLLARATASLQGALRFSMMLGPPVAGVLVGLLGTVPVILLDAASFVLSLLVLRRFLPTTAPAPAAPSRCGAAGARALLARPLAATWSLALVCSEFAWQGLFAAVPVVALEFGDRGPSVAGALSGAFGAAALTGTLLVGPLLRRTTAPVLAVGGRVLLALCFAVLLLPLGLTAVFGCLVLAGLLNGVSSAPVAAVRALSLPAAVRAEALTVATAVALAGGTCGLLVTGTTIQSAGTHTVFLILSAAQAASAVLHVTGLLRDRPAPGDGHGGAGVPDRRGPVAEAPSSRGAALARTEARRAPADGPDRRPGYPPPPAPGS